MSNIETVVNVVEDNITKESAKADKRKKKTEAEVSQILKAAFASKKDGDSHD